MSRVASRIERFLPEPEAQLDASFLHGFARPTVARYRRYLCDVYSLLEPVERAVVYSGDLEIGFVQVRIKSGKVATDLLALGLTATEYTLLARRFEMPLFASRIESLAWLYVATRIARAHESLRLHLVHYLPREMAIASSFLRSHHDEQWSEMMGVLEAHTVSDLDRTQLVATMRTATHRVREWLEAAQQPSVFVQPMAAGA